MFLISFVFVIAGEPAAARAARASRVEPPRRGARSEAIVMSALPTIAHWHAGGRWPGRRPLGDVHDPATGRVRPGSPSRAAPTSTRVVAGAAEAAREWAAASVSRRTSVLFAFREALHRRREEVAGGDHRRARQGPRRRARARCSAGSRSPSSPAVRRTCSRGRSPTASRRGVDVYSLRQPLGVVAVISPFNFPAMVPLWFVPVAIACGNAFVLKPSEKDPSPRC